MAPKHDRERYRFNLTFDAQLLDSETGEAVTDLALLRLLDGIKDDIDLAELIGSEGIRSGIGIHCARPRLRLKEKSARLVMEIKILTDREATPEDVAQIGAVCTEMIEGRWGENHEFELPDALDETLMVYFESTPHPHIPSLGSDAMVAVMQPWLGWTYETLEALVRPELERLQTQLKPHAVRDYTATGLQRQVWDLYEAVGAQLSRRAVSRADVPKVDPLDDLDKLDDLPKDVF